MFKWRQMSDQELHNIVQKSFQDPIAELLLKYSNITSIQFETLIIDLLTDIISDEKLSIHEKALFRRDKVSRGSFSRTLSQARSRVISSIFTTVLLSYIGVFSARPFDEYQILAEKLREYTEILESGDSNYRKLFLKRIEDELVEGITALSRPTSIKIV